MEKIKIPYPVIVEGKYDKIKLGSVIDADIFTSEGFAIFRDAERKAMLRRLCDKEKIIVFTDSDGAGLVIRNHLCNIIGKDKIINLYTPQTKGKERRKAKASKAGLLGVEGQDAELLYALFLPYASKEGPAHAGITKLDFYNLGLSGKDGSQIKRKALCRKAGLPDNISADALLCAVNLLYTKEEFIALAEASTPDIQATKTTPYTKQ